MSNTWGFGISTSFGFWGEFSAQRALVRDGATGEWYYVETMYHGVGWGVATLDGSLDVFTLEPGRSVDDLRGPGEFSYVQTISSTGLIYNSDGELIGVQEGIATNIGIGDGDTFTTVIPLADAAPELLEPLRVMIPAALLALALGGPLAALTALVVGYGLSPLTNILRDPLIFDLDGDGIELSALENSDVHFDFDSDGFSERTGWVSSDDGILVRDSNGNGAVDGAKELFGSPTQDGFAVLERLDSNGDGRIDATDERFAELRVWRDFNQDGVADTGELATLTQAGIQSISLAAQDVVATNQGHIVGNEATFTRPNGEIGAAQTIYFETDRQDTATQDNTPNFEMHADVRTLPQLPGSGQINSIAWKASTDASFRSEWAELTENSAALSFDELKEAFESLLLQWADVDNELEFSRGEFVDARHIAFVEKFFGTQYSEVNFGGDQIATSPTREQFGASIEASFEEIVDALLTVFLFQSGTCNAARGGDLLQVATSPYFAYALLNFGHESPDAGDIMAMKESVGTVVELIVSMAPGQTGDAAVFLLKALGGLEGVVSTIFAGDRAAYTATTADSLGDLNDPVLQELATAIIGGQAALGSIATDGLVDDAGDNLFVGGKGNDVIISGEGDDLFVYSKTDGSDFIRESSTSTVEHDKLLLTDISSSEVTFERIGEHLVVKVTETGEKITSENFFKNWGEEAAGIDSIVFKDGTVFDREAIRATTTTVGDDRSNYIEDSDLDDVIWAGAGHDKIDIGLGNDTILYGEGDGNDRIADSGNSTTQTDTLILTGLKPSDVELSRVGTALVVKIIATGEYLTDEKFFSSGSSAARGWGIDRIQFENGATWNRQAIDKAAWIRGDDQNNTLAGEHNRNDVLAGGAGSDMLSGRQGSDTYVWKKGDGDDTIAESDDESSATDKLILSDVARGDVRFVRSGTDLMIQVISTGEVIKVESQFYNIQNIATQANTRWRGLETIEFKNGLTLDRDQFMKAIENTGFDYDIKVWRTIFSAEGNVEGYELLDYGANTMGDQFHQPQSGGGSITVPPLGLLFQDELGNSGDVFDPNNTRPLYSRQANGFDDIFYGTDDHEYIGNQYGANSADPTIDEDFDFHAGGGGGLVVQLPFNGPVSNAGDNFFDGRDGNDKLVGGSGHDALIGGAGNDVLYGDGSHSSDTAVGGFDYLNGGDGNDVLRGGGANDVLLSGAGADRLYGGAGSDYLYDTGDGSNDHFDGGSGDDIITSGSFGVHYDPKDNGADTYVYRLGDGNDVITDFSSANTDVDTLKLLNVNAGDVALDRAGNDLVVNFGSTDQRITVVDFFSHNGSVGTGIDVIAFGNGDTWNRQTIYQHAGLRGTDDEDYLQSNYSNDNTFIGRTGDDVIVSATARGSGSSGSANGNDVFIYKRGDGNDIYFEGSKSLAEIDRLVLVDIDSDEVELSWVGNDLLIRDQISGQTITNEGFMESWGSIGQGIDTVEFADGVSWGRSDLLARAIVRGTNTSDTLQNTSAQVNTFWADRGNDTITSESGSDIFIYALDDGNDVITDSSTSLSEIDVLKLSDIDSDDVRLSVVGSDLVLSILPSGEQIIDKSAFYERTTTGRGLDRIEFGDGEIWDREDIRFWAQEGSIYYLGTTSSESIVGSHLDQNLNGNGGHDTIDGRAGSDEIYGGDGDDVLAISVSVLGDLDLLDGQAGNDTVSLTNLGSSVFVDLVLNGGEVRTSDAAAVATSSDRLIATLASIQNVSGSVFDDVLMGDDAANKIAGNAGDDVINGYMGDDTISGNAGDDSLAGGLGNDTYVYAPGEGTDSIQESSNQGTLDTLKLVGVLPSEMTFTRSGDDLLVQISGSSGGIRLLGATGAFTHYDQFGVERFTFDNGVTWDAAFLRQWSVYDSATDGDDNLVGTTASGNFGGGKGNDFLNAGGGNDTYLYSRGHGNDTISEITNALGNADKLQFTNIGSTEVTLVRSGIDLTLVIGESSPGAGDAGSVLIRETLDDNWDRGIETISFADGVNWTRAQVRSLLLAQAATNGNDTIVGFNTNDTLAGGLGHDVLSGAAGSDTYLYTRGDGSDTVSEIANAQGNADKLTFTNISSTEVSLVRSGIDLTLVIGESSPGAGDAGSVLIRETLDDNWDRGIETISFADGVNWTRAQVRSLVLSQAATSGNDTIVGFNGNDTLAGGLGNDFLSGAAGSDTYLYTRGDGDDTISEVANAQGSADKLQLVDIASTGVTLVRNGNDLIVMVAESSSGAGDSGYLVLKESINVSSDRGIETISFSNGVNWNRSQMVSNIAYVGGTAGSETITGTTANDVIIAGRGNDTLIGLAGNDTFTFEACFGQDAINDFAAGAGIGDVIRLKDGLFSDFASVLAATMQAGSDALITYDATNSIRLKNILVTNLNQDDFMFG